MLHFFFVVECRYIVNHNFHFNYFSRKLLTSISASEQDFSISSLIKLTSNLFSKVISNWALYNLLDRLSSDSVPLSFNLFFRTYREGTLTNIASPFSPKYSFRLSPPFFRLFPVYLWCRRKWKSPSWNYF